MYGIKQLYRKDYSGEEVNTIGLFKDSKWAYQTSYITNPFTNLPKSNNALVIGNGITQQGFDLKLILENRNGVGSPWKMPAMMPKKFNTYGCNALYRDYKPDFLIVTGDQIADELVNSGYCDTGVVYGRGYHVPQYPGRFHFVPQDPQWNAGAVAAYLAAFDGHKKVFLFGFDGADTDNYFYNVYAGTPGYPTVDTSILEDYWIRSMLEVFNTYKETEFIRVARRANARVPDPWKYCLNFRAIDINRFPIECGL
jgi:hypothetical protein